MQFDTALNLVWLVLGVFALASTLRARRQTSVFVRGPVWLHLCGVALIVAALFPYISATDDVLRIQRMDLQQTEGHQHQSGNKGSSDALIRLYETMDTPVITVVTQVEFVLLFISLVVAPILRTVDRVTLLQGGRSPPLLSV